MPGRAQQRGAHVSRGKDRLLYCPAENKELPVENKGLVGDKALNGFCQLIPRESPLICCDIGGKIGLLSVSEEAVKS